MLSGFKDHLLDIVSQLIGAVKKKDLIQIKDLSNQTIHSLTIFQDNLSRDIAVMTYSLFKILGRTDYFEKKGWDKFYSTILEDLSMAKSYLKNDEIDQYTNSLTKIQKSINILDPKIQEALKEVFEESKIAKASRITEHGVSLGQAASTLKVSPWELQKYTGQTGISEKGITKDIRKRIEFAKSLFQ